MTRGDQVEQVMADLNMLARLYQAEAAAAAANLGGVLASGDKLAPEVIAAARQIEIVYRTAAAKLSRMAKKLEPYTLSQEEGYGSIYLNI